MTEIKPENSRVHANQHELYDAIFTRRDIRGQFLSTPIPDTVLSRILLAAHYAPSVGFMQPWSFIVIRSTEIRKKVHSLFLEANNEAEAMFGDSQAAQYRRLKLEGITDSPLNICITCDRDRAGEVVIGRTHNKSMDLYSTVCAVQNLWLAAKTEGLGVGWVSIFNEDNLKELLGIPNSIVPIAYLCLGYVSHFPDKPELQDAGWRSRLKASELIHINHWSGPETDENLKTELNRHQQALENNGSLFEHLSLQSV